MESLQEMAQFCSEHNTSHVDIYGGVKIVDITYEMTPLLAERRGSNDDLFMAEEQREGQK